MKTFVLQPGHEAVEARILVDNNQTKKIGQTNGDTKLVKHLDLIL